jgi:putative molybdopterin biosynthesis protein
MADSQFDSMAPGPGHRRRYYLQDVPLDEARRRFEDALGRAGVELATQSEAVPLGQAAGRVTAGPVWALRSSPHYDAAAMDGIAVRSGDTTGATETAPIALEIGTAAVWLDTGDPMPEGFDAVVMIEHVHGPSECNGSSGDRVEIRAPAAPYQHVRPIGEDIAATELVLPGGHRLRPQDLGACAAAGVSQVAVRAQPTVAIVPTGTELVAPGTDAAPGQVIEYNSIMLAAQVAEWGGVPAVKDPVTDDPALIEAAIKEAAATCDVVVINAGSSAGSEDFTARAVEALGELAVHGVAVRPGHPVVLGVVGNTPVLGIPGYPVSALVTSELFLRNIIDQCLGLSRNNIGPEGKPSLTNGEVVQAIVTRKITSPIGDDEFLRVRLGRVEGKLVATPVHRGAGVIMSLVNADGIALLPRFTHLAEAGSTLNVELLRPLSVINNTILISGSHDMTLDLLANLLDERNGTRLTSASFGSLGGLLALERGEAHVAGTHLLDPDTGEYNLSYIKRHIARPVMVTTLVHRIQGLMVAPGNPLGLTAISDLADTGVRFVNRQRGSGTRVLFDHELSQLEIEPGSINGYSREEYTHLAVAAAVKAGRADVGLGIQSGARAIGLDFVPLLKERFDLVIPASQANTGPVVGLLNAIRSPVFKTRVEELGGYDTAETGEIVAELPAPPRSDA